MSPSNGPLQEQEKQNVNMLRVWPVICEFGIGAVLCFWGIWCGLRGGYLNLKIAEDRRLLLMLIAGYVFLLALICFFTFLAPNWANGGTL
jgi:hypothetical protein